MNKFILTKTKPAANSDHVAGAFDFLLFNGAGSAAVVNFGIPPFAHKFVEAFFFVAEVRFPLCAPPFDCVIAGSHRRAEKRTEVIVEAVAVAAWPLLLSHLAEEKSRFS